MPRFVTTLVILAVTTPLFSQAGFNSETGLSVFQKYTYQQYAAAPENWAATQDQRGVMYFGNTNGVLEFDGSTWRTIRLANGSTASSVATDQNGTVYVGGEGDFGRLAPTQSGAMTFVSLLVKGPPKVGSFLALL